MPTLWIAVFAAVLALGIAGWVRSRGRAARPERTSLPSPDAMLEEEGGHEAAPWCDDDAPGRDLATECTQAADPSVPEPEQAILQRLCVQAFDGAGVARADRGPPGALALAEAAALQTLAGIRAHPRYTPRRPHLLPQLSRAINDPGSNAQSIAAILAQDPALAGNLLRIANSAVYRRQDAPIEHLERAVTILGTEGLRQIVMAALLQPVISDDGSVFARCAAVLWEHTLASASIAMRPSRHARREDLHAAQLLALLYGLGSVMVVHVLRDSCGKHGAAPPATERLVELLDAWSVRCARAICAEWGLPGRVQQALEELAAGVEWEAMGRLGRQLRSSRAHAAEAMPGAPQGPDPGIASAPSGVEGLAALQ